MLDKKVLITTDFHTSKNSLIGLDKLLAATAYDAVIMAGDLINRRTDELSYVEQFIALVQIKHQRPLFALHGNNEPQEAWQLYRDADINIHLQNRLWEGYNICGIGGWGYLDEAGFEDLSIENLVINQKTIFVTHIPPRNHEPQAKGPLVHLYGHKHVLAFSKQLGPTLHIQCPAGILGRVTELSLPSLKVNFVELPK